MRQETILKKLKYYRKKVLEYENMLISWIRTQEIAPPTQQELKIVKDICKQEWILEEELYSPSSTKPIVRARAKIVCELMKTKTYKRTASILWLANHSSVMYLYKKYAPIFAKESEKSIL
jgi:chromosomal replication initiation ATPase DnaA